MQIPSDLLRFVPASGRRAFCVLGRFKDDWMVVDSTGRIVTSGDLYRCAFVANESKRAN